jgi:hypothetical protein
MLKGRLILLAAIANTFIVRGVDTLLAPPAAEHAAPMWAQCALIACMGVSEIAISLAALFVVRVELGRSGEPVSAGSEEH